MAQNFQGQYWSSERVDEELKGIMKSIFEHSSETAKELGHEGDLQLGANSAAFLRVAEAMMAQGAVWSVS